MAWILTLSQGVDVAEASMIAVDEDASGRFRRVFFCSGVISLLYSGDLRYGKPLGQFFGRDMLTAWTQRCHKKK